MLRAAREFLDEFYEGCIPGERWAEVEREVRSGGAYRHTFEELAFGARAAWRNSARCIGRLFWKSLEVFDCRHLSGPSEIFQACRRHARWSLNEGKIRPAISVFALDAAPIHNRQFFSYAGFESGGDPLTRDLTRLARQRGWNPAREGDFELLPLLVGEEWFTWEPEDWLEVPIVHPELDWSHFGWRWYALPAVSDMRLEVGGLSYNTAPFSGYCRS